MDIIAARGGKQVWLGRSMRPFKFACPASSEYSLLLVLGDDDISDDDQTSLSEQFIRSGCRYAVCFGPTSSTWDDAIDMVGVMDEVDGRPSLFVMTTWHDDEPLDETVQFFAEHAHHFDDWSTKEFVVFVLGGSDQLHEDVRKTVSKQFGYDPPN